MSPFRTILFASDFSERSREAFRVACSLADEKTTRLFVLHAIDPRPEVAVMTASDRSRDFEDRLRACHVPARPVDVTYLARDGEASAVVLDVAERIGADLIVLGTHGRTGLLRLLAGSVAEAVLRQAHCPVLALRGGDKPLPPRHEIQSILVPTDHSPEGRSALTVARELARDLGARLVLLHVTLPVETTPGVPPYPVNLREELEILDTLRWQVEGKDLKSRVETVLRRGDIAAEVLGAAREAAVDLIVMGTHGRTGLRRLLMGSVAEEVVRSAECPVLVVREAVHAPQADPAPVLGAML